MVNEPSKRIQPSAGKLIMPNEDAAKNSMDVLKEMAATKWLTPSEEERKKIASFDLPEYLRRDSAIPYELMHSESSERIKNWYDEDRLLRELFSGKRGDTLIRAFKNFFPRVNAGDYEKAWEHISLISEQLPDMLAQIKYQSEFIENLSEPRREDCAELFIGCFRKSFDHYLDAQIAKLKRISFDEEFGAKINSKREPDKEEIIRINASSRSKIEAFFNNIDEFHEHYRDSVYTRLTAPIVDTRSVIPSGNKQRGR